MKASCRTELQTKIEYIHSRFLSQCLQYLSCLSTNLLIGVLSNTWPSEYCTKSTAEWAVVESVLRSYFSSRNIRVLKYYIWGDFLSHNIFLLQHDKIGIYDLSGRVLDKCYSKLSKFVAKGFEGSKFLCKC